MNNTIQSKLVIALTSPATWTLIVTVLYNALEANVAVLPTSWTPIISVLLLVLTSYLHSSSVQTAATLGRTN